jgi:hypothetical protein
LAVNSLSGNLFVSDDAGSLKEVKIEGERRILKDFKRVVDGGIKTVLTKNN